MAAAATTRALGRTFAFPPSTRAISAQCLPRGAQVALSRQAVRRFAASSRVEVKKYTEDHEWIELDADGKTGTIGISEYAAKALGDVVFVELPTADLEVSQGDSIGAVESVKSASDIMTPVSGKIIEANNVLEDKPGTINKSPEGEGWLAKIECSSPEEVDALMHKEGYQKFTEEADSK